MCAMPGPAVVGLGFHDAPTHSVNQHNGANQQARHLVRWRIEINTSQNSFHSLNFSEKTFRGGFATVLNATWQLLIAWFILMVCACFATLDIR
jgi:hypothetical protein